MKNEGPLLIFTFMCLGCAIAFDTERHFALQFFAAFLYFCAGQIVGTVTAEKAMQKTCREAQDKSSLR